MKAYRGALFHILDTPYGNSADNNHVYIEDGLLVINRGRILHVGPWSERQHSLPTDCTVHDRSGCLIMPGLIDTHIHLPQTDIIASYGKQLMDWLNAYTYPCEKRYTEPEVARETSRFFIRELLRNGTTTAQVLGTVHPITIDSLFEEALLINMRLVGGKVMMDRHAPPDLQDTPITSYEESKALIERWHDKHRFTYAVTPRFALTSSEEQLEMAGTLVQEFSSVRMHTHLAENRDEVNHIARAFPWSQSYLDVYNRFGLVCDRSVFAHCIHLTENDFQVIKEKGSAIAICPTSNLFLGSGLFDLQTIHSFDIKTGLGTDVGGGTSFSMFRTMAQAYSVCQLKGYTMTPFMAFYHASLGAARALGLDHVIGNFEIGKEADFIVINPERIPLLQRRLSFAESLDEIMFALMILGDDRMIVETVLYGEPVAV